MYTYQYVGTHTHVYLYTYTHVHKHICICIYTCFFTYVYIYRCTCLGPVSKDSLDSRNIAASMLQVHQGIAEAVGASGRHVLNMSLLYGHPQVDRIWGCKEYIMVHAKIVFYILQHGCKLRSISEGGWNSSR